MTAEERERLAREIEAEAVRIRDDPEYVDFLIDPAEDDYFSALKHAARLVREWPVEGPAAAGSAGPEAPAYRVGFRVGFRQDVVASNVFLELTRLVEVPFVPAIGMVFRGVFSTDPAGLRADLCEVKDLCYSLADGSIDCRVDESGGWSTDGPFTVEDARSLADMGCLVDGEADPEEWARKARLDGYAIPESDPSHQS